MFVRQHQYLAFLSTLSAFLLLTTTAQDADFLSVTDDPVYIARVAWLFATGRCWNFYSQSYRYPDLPNRVDGYEDVTFNANEVQNHLPRQTTGPESLRGLFHLQIPDMVPEVVSFFDSNEGGGLGLPLAGSPPQRRVRIMSQGVSIREGSWLRENGTVILSLRHTRTHRTGPPPLAPKMPNSLRETTTWC